MSEKPAAVVVGHGLLHLPSVEINAYNAQVRDGDGYLGDRATAGAFRAILDQVRDTLREAGDDPLGKRPTADFSKKKLDKLLIEGDPEAGGVVHGAIEEFATQLAKVAGRFLGLKAWRKTELVVVGGGLRASRLGELAIGRASVMLKAAGHEVRLQPIRHHPDEAGLIGAVQLAPRWMLAGHDAILAVDIGGSNIRAGLVDLHAKKTPDLSRSAVHELEHWCYADEDTKPGRGDAVKRMGEMLKRLVRRAEKDGLALAPFVGVGCPGVIAADGGIERGGQNLPGNWESSRFNLPTAIREQVPGIDGQETIVAMHNDAVVQGLSEVPFVQDVERWGVLTIGTGLGNAAFTNRKRSA